MKTKFSQMICDISLSLTISKAVTSVCPERPLLQFRFIAHHIYQGNLDRPVLSRSISLFLFLKKQKTSFSSVSSSPGLVNLTSETMFLWSGLYFLLHFSYFSFSSFSSFCFCLIIYLSPTLYHNLILSFIIFSSEFHDFVTVLVGIWASYYPALPSRFCGGWPWSVETLPVSLVRRGVWTEHSFIGHELLSCSSGLAAVCLQYSLRQGSQACLCYKLLEGLCDFLNSSSLLQDIEKKILTLALVWKFDLVLDRCPGLLCSSQISNHRQCLTPL